MAKEEIFYGMHPVLEAIEAGKPIDRVYMQDGLKTDLAMKVRAACRVANIYIHFVPQARIEGLAREKIHQGVVAISTELEFPPLEETVHQIVETGQVPLLVLLDRVTDVRNLGAIVRTMDAMGAQALIVPLQGSARINAEAIKASAGALYHLPVCREKNLRDAIFFMKEAGIRIIACHEKAGANLAQEDLSGPTCLIFGSESEGIHPALLKMCDQEVFIPMQGKIGSLNVSVAAGMCLYEASSQRKQTGF
jgi:23S rRNA (guanosine2251-2'-O)-methyltransferase